MASAFWLLSSFAVLAILSQVNGGPATNTGSNNPETDCMSALFQRAGLRSSHFPRYVQRFRTNGLGEEVLYDLSFLDLVKFLQGKAFNITHAGDVFRLHTCISDRGDCVRHSFCINGGTCVYSDITNAHVCKCTPHFHGNMCQCATLSLKLS